MSDERIAVLYGAAKCDHVAAVDLGSGEVIWTRQLHAAAPDGDDERPTMYAVTVAGGRVVTADSWELDGFDLSTGKHLWRTRPGRAGDCATGSVAASTDAVYATTQCPDAAPGNLVSLAPASGKVRWQRPLDAHSDGIANVDPLLVQVSGPDQFRVYDERGEIQSKILTSTDPGGFMPVRYLPSQEAHDGNPDFAIKIVGDLLVSELSGDGVIDSKVSAKAVAYHLPDGKRRWVTDLDEASLEWVDTDRTDRVTFLETGGIGEDGYLTTIDADTGDADKGPRVQPPEDSDVVTTVNYGYRLVGDTMVAYRRGTYGTPPGRPDLLAFR